MFFYINTVGKEYLIVSVPPNCYFTESANLSHWKIIVALLLRTGCYNGVLNPGGYFLFLFLNLSNIQDIIMVAYIFCGFIVLI